MVVAVGGFRFSRRLWIATGQRFEATARRILIVGAGDLGESVARTMLADASSGLRPAAFASRHSKKVGSRIHNIPVLGQFKDIASILKREQIERSSSPLRT
jgi:FlaA1/EpsC-like NDP-sugar epimerase